MITFNLPEEKSSIIKVIGVGGGGSNAVNHMFSQTIEGVNYVICNTDNQALEMSEVPNKIQLGVNLRQGLGAGNKPEIGREATEESIDQIEELLQTNTKMVFITAGMGGGTGTGGAPVIAKLAKDMDILTVGIVTTPFGFEGIKRKKSAQLGIEELKKEVDALLVISNDKLIDIYGSLKLSQAFAKADSILTTAAKGIAEIITKTGYINVDFEDVNTVMKDSGVALMGVGFAEGENRALEAIDAAMNSPLLNDNNIVGAKSVLLNIGYGNNEPEMDELKIITKTIEEAVGVSEESETLIWGVSEDKELGESLSITLIATGFESNKDRSQREEERQIILPLGSKDAEGRVKVEFDEAEQRELDFTPVEEEVVNTNSNAQPITESFTLHTLEDASSEENTKEEDITAPSKDRFIEVPAEGETINTYGKDVPDYIDERLKRFNVKKVSSEQLDELESIPAYKRKGNLSIEEENSYNDEASDYSLGKSNNSDDYEIKKNSYLHNNPD